MTSTAIRKNVKQVDFAPSGKGSRKKGKRPNPSSFGYIDMIYKIKADMNRLKRAINVEDKYIDTAVGLTAFASTAAVLTLLNGCQLGNTASTRNGQSTKGVNLQFTLRVNQAAAATNTVVRFILLWDKQPNSVTFAGNDLLVDSTNPISLRYAPYLPRFDVLHDEVIVLTSNNLHSYVTEVMQVFARPVQYNTSNAGTIADLNRNALFLYLQSDEGTNFASYSFYSRFSFVDN